MVNIYILVLHYEMSVCHSGSETSYQHLIVKIFYTCACVT